MAGHARRTLRPLTWVAVAVICALQAPPAAAGKAGPAPSMPPALAAALAVQTEAATDYRIGPLDKLNIVVFEVKDLTIENLPVDASGQILLPLIGSVVAGGKTTTELSEEIAARLKANFLQSPQVSVTVAGTASQKITVEGAVNEAGVFELKGRTSLLEAVARAKGLSKAANSHHVAIIRTLNGAPRAATFDLAAISAGRSANPEVLANDVVVVDTSKSKAFWHGMIEVLPALYVFQFL